MKPYGVISDTHNHAWNAFATTTPEGINSRLDTILRETYRAARTVAEAGGDTLLHGGDLFHVRGSVAPSVLNPTRDTYKAIRDELGVQVVIAAGNHDLEGKEAARISSAITALEDVGCAVINEPTVWVPKGTAGADIAIVPWIPNVAALKAQLETGDPAKRADCDLLIHAPVDGVIPGLPDHGLDGAYLASLGFRRVFSGHYHHHKEIVAGKVWSIGSLTPQTWSDVNAKSGFLIVSDAGVKWHASHAPHFVDIDGSTDPADVPLIVDGNYVRARIASAKQSEVEALRQHLLDCGAAGVNIIQVKDTTIVPRAGGAMIKAGATLDQSVQQFITAKGFGRQKDLGALCADILTGVRSVRTATA